MSRFDTDLQRPRPTPRTIGIAALVVLTLALLAWLALRDQPTTAAPEPEVEPTSSTATESTGDPSPTPQPTEQPTDDQVVDPIDELTFVEYGGIDLPVHPVAGPTQVEPNGRALGFEDSELGAALAAIHLSIRASGAGPIEVVGDTINEQFVAADDRDRLLAEANRLNAARVQETGDPSAPNDVGELVGFRVSDFAAGESAVVDVLALSRGAFGYTTVQLVGVDDGWKAQAPFQGLWTNQITAPAEPDGFTIWKDF